ncbi:GNAT family N-acetyltransferase [uncultured Sphingomonas sp.]|uniref:GNAT family N-acetyltransferase n=1 Tax=uncultured Sphingomonas sp. TaxID=158754 RepID=UPI0025CEE48D|nr:GNAT family N-acetyltransferase [uncultured Sphingomonas sp.]
MFAVTERLLLRPGWVEDAPALAHAIGDGADTANLDHVHWPVGVQDAEAFLSQSPSPHRPRFLVALRDGNRVIGGVALSGDSEAELSFWIARDHRGRGYATEAGRAVLALADSTLRLDRVKARCATDNLGSARVLRTLGFHCTGQIARLVGAGRGATLDARVCLRERTRPSHALAA